MKVLIVDDEPLVRRSLEKVFKRKEHEVCIAEDGEAGIEKWKSFQPDLVFLDVLMPKYNGPQVLKHMKPFSSAKIILISAYTGEHNLETAQEMGAHLFLSKPFEDIYDVVKKAEDLLNASREESKESSSLPHSL